MQILGIWFKLAFVQNSVGSSRKQRYVVAVYDNVHRTVRMLRLARIFKLGRHSEWMRVSAHCGRTAILCGVRQCALHTHADVRTHNSLVSRSSRSRVVRVLLTDF